MWHAKGRVRDRRPAAAAGHPQSEAQTLKHGDTADAGAHPDRLQWPGWIRSPQARGVRPCSATRSDSVLHARRRFGAQVARGTRAVALIQSCAPGSTARLGCKQLMENATPAPARSSDTWQCPVSGNQNPRSQSWPPVEALPCPYPAYLMYCDAAPPCPSQSLRQ